MVDASDCLRACGSVILIHGRIVILSLIYIYIYIYSSSHREEIYSNKSMPLALYDCLTSHEQQLNGINILTLWCCNKKKSALNAKIILGLLWEVEVLIVFDFFIRNMQNLRPDKCFYSRH